jgi:G3E family GTPase
MSNETTRTHAGRIPLIVIGGFLGSGKTTLLNHLLKHNDGRRLAVLVNDFGAINVDAALVVSRGADTISLQNGCVCCQIGGDLTDALIRVIGSTPPPDAIVIEASGVSDPWRIAQVGLSDPALALDGVIVMVDATSVLAQADDPLLGDTVLRQLRAADLLVLNKCDRVDELAMQRLHDWLDANAPDIPHFETHFAQVPLALLGAPGWPREMEAPAQDDAGLALHGDLFASWSNSADVTYHAAALRELLRAMPEGVLRLKGVIRTDLHGWAVLQFSGRHGSLRAWPPRHPLPIDGAASAIVAIGLRDRLPTETLALALQKAVKARTEDAPTAASPLPESTD